MSSLLPSGSIFSHVWSGAMANADKKDLLLADPYLVSCGTLNTFICWLHSDMDMETDVFMPLLEDVSLAGSIRHQEKLSQKQLTLRLKKMFPYEIKSLDLGYWSSFSEVDFIAIQEGSRTTKKDKRNLAYDLLQQGEKKLLKKSSKLELVQNTVNTEGGDYNNSVTNYFGNSVSSRLLEPNLTLDASTASTPNDPSTNVEFESAVLRIDILEKHCASLVDQNRLLSISIDQAVPKIDILEKQASDTTPKIDALDKKLAHFAHRFSWNEEDEPSVPVTKAAAPGQAPF